MENPCARQIHRLAVREPPKGLRKCPSVKKNRRSLVRDKIIQPKKENTASWKIPTHSVPDLDGRPNALPQSPTSRPSSQQPHSLCCRPPSVPGEGGMGELSKIYLSRSELIPVVHKIQMMCPGPGPRGSSPWCPSPAEPFGTPPRRQAPPGTRRADPITAPNKPPHPSHPPHAGATSVTGQDPKRRPSNQYHHRRKKTRKRGCAHHKKKPRTNWRVVFRSPSAESLSPLPAAGPAPGNGHKLTLRDGVKLLFKPWGVRPGPAHPVVGDPSPEGSRETQK